MDNLKKEFDVVLVNYANNLFRESQKRNRKTAIAFKSFDRVISYNSNDIDNLFLNKNKKILEQKRGNGYWLWKPYFVKKVLEDLKWGDFLFYCDSGGYFINSIEKLISLSLEKKQDVIPFELAHIESEWTKRDAFLLMNCDTIKYYDTNQRLASFFFNQKDRIVN
jgi:hypothetical protein